MISQIEAFKADLHVHTVVSPCAEVEMIPPLIVERALDLDLRLIAITDHNSTANVAAVMKAAENTPLHVLPGMELQTREEVHSLCLFDSIDQVTRLQTVVSARLPKIQNDPDHFGEQFIVDEEGEFIKREDQLLLVSSNLSINEAWLLVNQLGGIFIPAHVNRKAFGLLEILGLVPTDIQIEALEISRHISIQDAPLKYPQIIGYPILQNGDVHRLNEFNEKMIVFLEKPTISDLRLALRESEGRRISFID